MQQPTEVNDAIQSPPQAPAAACKQHFEIQPAKPPCKCQKLVAPRRTHALVGLAFTTFLAVHLSLCATGLNPVSYQRNVNRVEAMLAHLPEFILLAVFLPFAAQAFTGLFLIKTHGIRYNVKKCNRGGKLRFFLQRSSALVILAFFVIHVATLHAWGLHLVYRLTHWSALARYSTGGLFQAHAAFPSTVLGFQQAWTVGSPGSFMNAAVMIFGLLSVFAAAFHAANGAWTGGIVWKIVDTKGSNFLWATLCCAVGVVLLVAGSVAWYSFTFSAPAQAVISNAGW